MLGAKLRLHLRANIVAERWQTGQEALDLGRPDPSKASDSEEDRGSAACGACVVMQVEHGCEKIFSLLHAASSP